MLYVMMGAQQCRCRCLLYLVLWLCPMAVEASPTPDSGALIGCGVAGILCRGSCQMTRQTPCATSMQQRRCSRSARTRWVGSPAQQSLQLSKGGLNCCSSSRVFRQLV